MDPSRNRNKVTGRSAFMPFCDGVVVPLEFGVPFAATEFVGGSARFGSAGGWTVTSGTVPPSNRAVPPDAGVYGKGPENQPKKNGSKKKSSLEQFQLTPKRK